MSEEKLMPIHPGEILLKPGQLQQNTYDQFIIRLARWYHSINYK
jgi:hypothetical protein